MQILRHPQFPTPKYLLATNPWCRTGDAGFQCPLLPSLTLWPGLAMTTSLSLCLLLGLFRHTLAVGECDINPHSANCEGTDRAAWGYLASNGPVHIYTIHNWIFILTSSLLKATWATNFPEFCAGDMQSPIDLDTSKAVTMDPGPITMVDKQCDHLSTIIKTPL